MPVLATVTPASVQNRTAPPDAEALAEIGDEVVFQVGVDNVMRVSARKSVLSSQNEVFYAMFCGSYSQANVRARQVTVTSDGSSNKANSRHPAPVDYISEPDLDGRAFINLVKFLNGETVELRSVITAVETLHAAQKYLCPGLLTVCVNYLTSQLSVANVLQILRTIRNYVKPIRELSDEPSAPPLELIEQGDQSNSCSKICAQLFTNCLEFVDQNASAVLSTEDFEELDAEVVECIITRDELVINNEAEVLAALVRWSAFACQCRQIPVNIENQRRLMDRLLWHVRFLTMTPKELKHTPLVSELLTPDEYSLVLSHANGRASPDRLPLPIRRQVPYIAKPRKCTIIPKQEVRSENQDTICDKEYLTEKFFNCLLCIFE